MKHLIQKIFVAAFAVGMAGLVGCEWSGGSSDNSWNDSSSIANFSGTYQGNGGYLVSEYSLSSISPGAGVIYSDVTGEGAGSGASGNSTFSGVVANKPIKPGSLTLTLSGDLGSFRDNGSGVETTRQRSGLVSINWRIIPAHGRRHEVSWWRITSVTR